jgi:hypothetical protein
MKSQNPQKPLSGQMQPQEPSTSPLNPSPSPGHVKLARILRWCAGCSPELQAGLGALDDDTAVALAYMLEVLQAQASRSAGGAWVRGFAAGQQF